MTSKITHYYLHMDDGLTYLMEEITHLMSHTEYWIVSGSKRYGVVGIIPGKKKKDIAEYVKASDIKYPHDFLGAVLMIHRSNNSKDIMKLGKIETISPMRNDL